MALQVGGDGELLDGLLRRTWLRREGREAVGRSAGLGVTELFDGLLNPVAIPDCAVSLSGQAWVIWW